MNNKAIKLYKMILIISIFFSFIYMIISLNSEYRYLYDTLYIIGKQQIKLHKLFINNYIFDNNFYIINPGMILVIFKNNYIIRFIMNIIFVSIYIFLLYKISNMYFNKYQKIIFFIILLCGISQDYMLSIFMYNEFIYQTILLMGVYYFLIKLFDNISSFKIIIFSLLILLFSINSFCLLYIVIIPYAIVKVIFELKDDHKNNFKIIILIILSLILYLYYLLMNKTYSLFSNTNTLLSIGDRFMSILDIIFNMFGISSGNSLISIDNIYTGFFPNNSIISPYSLLSLYGITVLCRFAFMVFTIIIVPILLFKNRMKNSNDINKLALFNFISIICNILLYVLLGTYSYTNIDIKYFIFNFIIMFILDIYVINKYLPKYDFMNKIIHSFFIIFVLLNIITNIIYL